VDEKQKSFEEISKTSWAAGPTSSLTLGEKVTLGSLQRIATATESMAVNFREMQSSLDYYKTRAKRLEEENKRLQRRLSAQKGATTKAAKKGQTP